MEKNTEPEDIVRSNEIVQSAFDIVKDVIVNAPVLLFGSYAHGCAKSSSDVDILIVSNEGRRRSLVEKRGIRIDLNIEPEAVLNEALEKKRLRHNNFLLDILASSIVLRDYDGVAAKLVFRAACIYKQGPPSLSSVDADIEMSALEAMLSSLDRLRTEESDEAEFFYKYRQDQIAQRSFNALLKAAGVWSSAFPRTVGSALRLHPELKDAWLSFVCPSTSARAAIQPFTDC